MEENQKNKNIPDMQIDNEEGKNKLKKNEFDTNLHLNLDNSKNSGEDRSKLLDSEKIEDDISLDEEKDKKLTKIGNKTYDKDTINRITIVRLTQAGLSHSEIKKILKVNKSLITKWMNYDKMKSKKMGRPPKFTDEHKQFIYTASEGKLTILNKASSRNIAVQFSENFSEKISKTSVIFFF